MRVIPKLVLAAASVMALSVPAAAQAPGVDLTLNPRVGFYVPLTDLGDAGGELGTIVSEKSGNLALGLGAELNLGVLPVGLRANIDYATGSEVTPEGIGESTERSVFMLAGDVIFRPLPTLILIQPYVFGGGGVRRYDFDTGDVAALDDASDPMIHLGGGLDLTLGPLALNAELGDYISWYEVREGADSETQHDLFVTVGLVLSLL